MASSGSNDDLQVDVMRWWRLAAVVASAVALLCVGLYAVILLVEERSESLVAALRPDQTTIGEHTATPSLTPSPEPTSTPKATSTPPPTNSPEPPPTLDEETNECPHAPERRLIVSGTGRVAYRQGQIVRVRAGPSTEYDPLYEMKEGTRFTVIDGPVCSGGWWWWQIRTEDDRLPGWSAEGNHYLGYLLEPFP